MYFLSDSTTFDIFLHLRYPSLWFHNCFTTNSLTIFTDVFESYTHVIPPLIYHLCHHTTYGMYFHCFFGLCAPTARCTSYGRIISCLSSALYHHVVTLCNCRKFKIVGWRSNKRFVIVSRKKKNALLNVTLKIIKEKTRNVIRIVIKVCWTIRSNKCVWPKITVQMKLWLKRMRSSWQ